MNWIIAGLLFLGAAASTWLITRLRFYSGRPSLDCSFPDTEYPDERNLLATQDTLEKLLSEDDLDFLSRQPGYTPEIGRQLRRNRIRIARLCLRQLAWHFSRLYLEAIEIASLSGAEHAPLVGRLIRQRIAFWAALVRIDMGLAAATLGARNTTRVRIAAVHDVITVFETVSITP